MIMTKFQKRVSKIKPKPQNAVVYGTGHGHLEEIVDLFKTVFVLVKKPSIKAKNIVYSESFDIIHILNEIDFIFVDLEYKDNLDKLVPLWRKHRPFILIEGDEVLDRVYTKTLYSTNYRCTANQGFFHVWELKQ